MQLEDETKGIKLRRNAHEYYSKYEYNTCLNQYNTTHEYLEWSFRNKELI